MTNSKSWNVDENNEKTKVVSFPQHADDMGDYRNPEEPGEKCKILGSLPRLR